MTTTINASTSSGLVVTPDNSGNILLQYNGVAAPAFSAYKSSNQSLSSGVQTKITFDTEEFDTANCYASSRFTPTVAGYYQINAMINSYDATSTSAPNLTACYIFKNGTRYQDGVFILTLGKIVVNSLVYLNGSTDYIEIYGYVTSASTTPGVYGTSLGGGQSYFNGCLLRGA